MSNLHEETPVNEQEVLAAMSANEKNRQERALVLTKLILENIEVCQIGSHKPKLVMDACLPHFRVVIRVTALHGRVYDYMPRIYGDVQTPCAVEHRPYWFDRSKTMSFNKLDDLIDFVLDTHLN